MIRSFLAMYEVLVLQDLKALNWHLKIKELLSEFSSETAGKIAAGVYDPVLNETFRSPHAYFCLVRQRTYGDVVGMYVGTVMPVALHRRLYVDAVVVAKSSRKQGILTNVIIPHMRAFATKLECQTIDFTSSKSEAQALYEKAGFSSPTTAFRMVL
jgi:hypothetical protein